MITNLGKDRAAGWGNHIFLLSDKEGKGHQAEDTSWDEPSNPVTVISCYEGCGDGAA